VRNTEQGVKEKVIENKEKLKKLNDRKTRDRKEDRRIQQRNGRHSE
jgi:hypothetical protein